MVHESIMKMDIHTTHECSTREPLRAHKNMFLQSGRRASASDIHNSFITQNNRNRSFDI
jgi:hypothetical protein